MMGSDGVVSYKLSVDNIIFVLLQYIISISVLGMDGCGPPALDVIRVCAFCNYDIFGCRLDLTVKFRV